MPGSLRITATTVDPGLLAQPWDQPLDAIATPTAFHLVAHGARGLA